MKLTNVIIICVLLVLLNSGCKKCDCSEDNFSELINITWVLETIYNSSTDVIQVSDRYSIIFKEDKTVDLIVDCNSCSGSINVQSENYISLNNSLACTEVACGPDSNDTEFYLAIEKISRYEIINNKLFLYFNDENGYLIFSISYS